MAFEIARCSHVVVRGKEAGVLLAEHILDLGQGPHVELSLLALGIGIEGGAERALRRRHLPLEPADGLARPRAEQRVAGALPCEREQLEDAARCRRASSRNAG